MNNDIRTEPSIEKGGTKMWYKNGELHREDGPAVIHPDGTEEYYLNGIQQLPPPPSEIKIDPAHLANAGPAKPSIEKDGTKMWYKSGELQKKKVNESNIVKFICSITEKKYSEADKYLQHEIDNRIRSKILKCLKDHE